LTDAKRTVGELKLYFDTEILEGYRTRVLDLPAECILNRNEFDLAKSMTLVLTPFRIFTKFVQLKSEVTLAYLPKKIDDLVSAMAPGAFAARLREYNVDNTVVAHMETFQRCLVTSIKERFASTFHPDSLAMGARMFLPGRDLFVFQHFELPGNFLNTVMDNLLNDFMELLPPHLTEVQRNSRRDQAQATLRVARELLLEVPEETNPLEWWPTQQEDLARIFSLAKMYLQIPASSAENERSFSSASFILDTRRNRLDLDNFRREHRIRRYLCAEGDKRQKCEDILNIFVDRVDALRAQLPQ
jgi:hypothetical protein